MNSKYIYKNIIDFVKSQITAQHYVPDMKLPTEAELAAEFGTSRNTVVKAFDVLKNEGYIFSIQGKGSFVSQGVNNANNSKTNIISLILPFSEDNFNRIDEFNVVRGIQSFLRSVGYGLMIHYSNDDPGEESQLIDKCREDGISGVIVYPSTVHNNLSFMYEIILDKYPMVFIDRNNRDLPIVSVQSDNTKGGFIATEHLLQCGYEDIYYVSDVRVDLVSSVRDRYFGYCKALKQANKKISKHWLIDGYAMKEMKYEPVSYEQDPRMFMDIVSKMVECSGDKRIGVFADNDLAAYSLIRACLESGHLVGEKIGVVGFNNAHIATRSIIPITTIKQDFFKIGEMSARTLLNIVNNNTKVNGDIYLDVQLIIRSSTFSGL
jgi:DNA-binding LacI/PurR family transcriptional regulator